MKKTHVFLMAMLCAGMGLNANAQSVWVNGAAPDVTTHTIGDADIDGNINVGGNINGHRAAPPWEY